MDGHIDQMYVCVCPEHPRRFQAVHYLKKVGGRSSKRWKDRYRPRNDGTWGGLGPDHIGPILPPPSEMVTTSEHPRMDVWVSVRPQGDRSLEYPGSGGG